MARKCDSAIETEKALQFNFSMSGDHLKILDINRS